MNESTTNNPTTATESTTEKTAEKTGVVGLMGTLRDELRARRAARAARNQLIRELASYTSPADQADLEATFARHSDEETAEVRRLLSIAQSHRAA